MEQKRKHSHYPDLLCLRVVLPDDLEQAIKERAGIEEPGLMSDTVVLLLSLDDNTKDLAERLAAFLNAQNDPESK